MLSRHLTTFVFVFLACDQSLEQITSLFEKNYELKSLLTKYIGSVPEVYKNRCTCIVCTEYCTIGFGLRIVHLLRINHFCSLDEEGNNLQVCVF